jgi:hypothetical protein
VELLDVGDRDGIRGHEVLARPAEDRDVVGHQSRLVPEAADVLVLGEFGQRHLLR